MNVEIIQKNNNNNTEENIFFDYSEIMRDIQKIAKKKKKK
jgi:hypothetical protein